MREEKQNQERNSHMKKLLAFLLAALLILSAGCASPSVVISQSPLPQVPAATLAPTAVPTPPENTQAANTDLVSLLSMTRKEVTALYGTGEPNPYGDISDYNETGYELYGFVCTYSKLNGVMVFYDAVPQADDAAPYYCIEDPNDPILGIMLPPGSAPFNVDGALPELDAKIIELLSKDYNANIEHIDGMYEYYKISLVKDGVQFIWRSDASDMADAQLYAQAAAPSLAGPVLVVPVLKADLETISNDIRQDGTYREESLFQSMVSIVCERCTSVEFSEDAIVEQIVNLTEVDLSEVTIEQDTPTSNRLSFPAWRLTYTTGANEDTRKNVDIYIQTDGWDYRFHTSTPIDAFADYSDFIEAWIESLELFDAGN